MVLLLTIGLAFSVAPAVIAQPTLEPCPIPDCNQPNTGWSLLPTWHVLPNGCIVEVTYRWRSGCGYHELEILSVRLPYAGMAQGAPCNIYFSGPKTPTDLINDATIAVLRANFMGFPPLEEGCSTTWRVYRSACWKDGIGMPDVSEPNTFFMGCGDACCRTDFQVCRDAAGNRTYTQIGQSAPPATCSDSWSVVAGTCVSICLPEGLLFN